MNINEQLIQRVSELARLDLTEEEKTEFLNQITDILNYVEKINELDTASVEPADHIMDLKNVFRKDFVEKSLDINNLEEMAPEFSNGHITVPRIIDGTE